MAQLEPFDPAAHVELEDARALDASDELAPFRARFAAPRGRDGQPVLYLCGHSLGRMPLAARAAVEQELSDWEALGVEGHFEAQTPWYSYHEHCREPLARLVGARPHEVVAMSSLTVNLHLLMVTFYRPQGARRKILVENAAFPSDAYAAQTQLRCHGFDPTADLLIARPRPGEHTLRTEDVEALLEREGERIALVLFGGVNYYTGQLFDIPRITAAAHRQGCVVGWDLAHAAGNVPLALHDWGVDFAAWCSYKYLNSGPGAVAGCFVHERHVCDTSLPRFGGWWGADPQTRFRMPLNSEFQPVASADAWQLSNPPILSLAPVRVSLEIFDAAGMDRLRAKSRRLTAYLAFLLEQAGASPASAARPRFEVITPADPEARGCQLSILAHEKPEALLGALRDGAVVCDFRPPNVVRVAPVPLYNTYEEVWRFADIAAAQRW